MSDFLSGFRMRPTIRLAPDCLVWVQQKPDAPVCSACGGRKSFQGDVVNVSISLSTESAPGNASFTIAVPRHGMTKYDLGGELVFQHMQEVEIWMRGRFLVDGDPKYYPVFWGLITGLSVDEGTDMWTISVQCDDILKWWEYTTLTINPAAMESQLSGQHKISTKHVFSNFNPYEIIMSLAILGFGDLLAYRNFGAGDQPDFVRRINEELVDRRDEIIVYWQRRFGQLARRLKIFGVNGYRLNRDLNDVSVERFAEEFWDQVYAGAGGRKANQTLPGLLYDRDQFGRFRFDEFIGSNDSLVESEQQTKMELALNAARSIGFEFFMDVTGDIIFKPPFYNMNVRDAGQVYTLLDEDILSLTFTDDSNGIYTRCDVTGRFAQLLQDTETAAVYGYFVDYHLMHRYGVRNLELQEPHIRTARGCYMHAVSSLSRENAKTRTAQVTILGRPELRLGRPVYIESHDLFGYVTGINHSFDFGGSFTTNLSLTALRPKYHGSDVRTAARFGAPSFEPGPDGKVQGQPNRAMVFRSEQFLPTSRAIQTVNDGELSGGSTVRSQFNEQYNAAFSEFEAQALAESKDRREVYGTAQGFWQEVEIPGVIAATERFLPVSDEWGYRHIGGFPYGRGMTIGGLETVVPYIPESADVRNLDARDVTTRTPTVIEQYGLTAGRSFGLTVDPARRRIGVEEETPTRVADPNALAEDQLLALKGQVESLRSIIEQQQAGNPSDSCSCTGETYMGALIEKVIRENRGLGAAERRSAQVRGVAPGHEPAVDALATEVGASEQQTTEAWANPAPLRQSQPSPYLFEDGSADTRYDVEE